ncbi:MAG: TIR domain-containing protein [Bacteroidetes bacterium]|nr:TIR domain-containing protein [Bacteroidota bacterium]
MDNYRSPEKTIRISGWVLRQNRNGTVPTLTSDMLGDLVEAPMPSRPELMNDLLIELTVDQTEAGREINIFAEPRFYAATYTERRNVQRREKLFGLARMLEDEGLVKLPPQSTMGNVRVTSQGYREADLLRAPEANMQKTQASPQLQEGQPNIAVQPKDLPARGNHQYQVALSFAGEQREYVEKVAEHLRERDIKVFYDGFEEVSLWGKSGAEAFEKVFAEQSAYVVMFISEEYRDKRWCRHERRAALSRMIEEKCEYVLPVRFDDTQIDGLPKDILYLEVDKNKPAELAAKITEKLGQNP